MSIANEITRLQTAKSNIKTALENKGVAVDSAATLDYYATYVDNIPSGGGGNAIIKSIDIEDFTGTTFNSSASYITGVTIPSGVTSIGGNAFNGCSKLTSIVIPSGVTNIGQSAFRGCSSLTSIDILSGVTSFGNYVFQGCSSLTSIDIPSGVTDIGQSAFRDCSSLTSITLDTATPPTLGGTAFDSTNNCPIYVPAESVETYKSASGWSVYADRIQAIPSE